MLSQIHSCYKNLLSSLPYFLTFYVLSPFSFDQQTFLPIDFFTSIAGKIVFAGKKFNKST